MEKSATKELINFIDASPTCFHAVANMKESLLKEGFVELKENEHWKIEKGGNYFVTRNDSAIIAFTIPLEYKKGVRIVASHSDSPSLKIKENPEMFCDGYIKLNVEGYGGLICSQWFDRPLSIAGRVIVKDKETNSLVTKLINIDKDLVMIPSLAIHMNRQLNEGYRYNIQKDMLPLYGDFTSKGNFMKTVTEIAGDRVLGHDLFLYNRQKGTIWGASEEFVSCCRLDNLQCAFATLKGFIAGKRKEHMSFYCVFDNEEVGSGTKQGAASTFLYDTLTRVHESLGLTKEDYFISLADGFMISADNGHAVHPNYPEKCDPVNRPIVNGGIVIKYNANQKYCTDGISAAMFKDLCETAGVPTQTFVNRSDIPGGSTLGNISNTQVALNTVDIGLPQLAMHSTYETAGVKDTFYLIKAITEFFN